MRVDEKTRASPRTESIPDTLVSVSGLLGTRVALIEQPKQQFSRNAWGIQAWLGVNLNCVK